MEISICGTLCSSAKCENFNHIPQILVTHEFENILIKRTTTLEHQRSNTGTNMGPEAKPGSDLPEPPKELVVKVGDAECTDIVLHSSTELTCKAPHGVGMNVPVTIQVDGLKSDGTTLVSYMLPNIRTIEPKIAAAGDEITIKGEHFGTENSELEVDFNGKESSNECSIVNDKTITCIVPPVLEPLFRSVFASRSSPIMLSRTRFPTHFRKWKWWIPQRT